MPCTNSSISTLYLLLQKTNKKTFKNFFGKLKNNFGGIKCSRACPIKLQASGRRLGLVFSSFCLSKSPSLSLSIHLSICQSFSSVSISLHLSVSPSIYLYASQSLSLHLYISLSLQLSLHPPMSPLHYHHISPSVCLSITTSPNLSASTSLFCTILYSQLHK